MEHRPSLRRRPVLAALASWAALAAVPTARAAGYPEHPVKLLVGFPPGTGPDVVARLLGQQMAEILKTPMVVDNRAGAGGQIAAQAVAKSAADGYTVLLGEVGSISIAPAAYSRLAYDPARDLVAVAEVVRSDFVLVVPAASPARTVAEFVTAQRAKKDRTDFVTFGAGTPGHFGAVVFADMAGFAVEPIHYRTTGDAIAAVANGEAQAAFLSTALAVAQVKGGRIRALATTAAVRSPLLPDVPTFTEAGYPKADFSAWFALLAPAGTPAPLLDALQKAAATALQSADVRSKLADAGFTFGNPGRAETERLLRSEATRWAAIVKATGFKGD